jgi:uncharacterized protein YndB with AHSA1/START domain
VWGTVSKASDSRIALRFERRFPHPQRKVWQAITNPDQLAVWFVEILDYERSQLHFGPDAELVYVAKGGDGQPIGHGQVLKVNPPHLLEYTWDNEVLLWELESEGEDACRLVFTTIVSEQGTAVAVAPGWHAGLDGLGAMLDGRVVDRSVAQELQENYARILG